MISITVNGTAYSVPSSAADTNWAANQVAFEQALASYVNTIGTLVAPPTWIAVEDADLLNSWVNGAEKFAYYKDATGRVYLRFSALSGGAPASSPYQLPSGYRPPHETHFTCPCDSGCYTLLVLSNGQVFIGAGIGGGTPGSGSYCSIDFSTTATP